MDKYRIVDQVEGLYKIVQFIEFRKTRSVSFAMLPLGALAKIDIVDRVFHGPGAYSPGSVENVERPWYMHPGQADNLLLIQGARYVELYDPRKREIVCFDVYPEKVVKNGETVCSEAGLLCWPPGVFHRIISCPENGSLALNFACHDSNFDWKTNFNVYDLDIETGESRIVREGWQDQTM